MHFVEHEFAALVGVPTASGKRALASRRRSTAQLTVTGTVIGVIQALLARQRVLLGASARRASTLGHAHRAF